MQPPAEVEPARISQVEQPFSRSDISRMSAARAVSREEKDILRIESMIGRASNLVMSICSMVFASNSAFEFLRDLATGFTGAAFAGAALVLAAVLAAMGRQLQRRGRQRATASPKVDLERGYSSVRLILKDKQSSGDAA